MISIRKIGVIGRTYRNLNRYRHILAVLFKYGFGDLVEHLKIEQYIEIGLQMISKKRRDRLERLTRAERIRMAIEELGPAFIKLGQILSTRPDLVPVDFINELSVLQDKVPSFSPDEAVRIIGEELRKPMDEVFTDFQTEPLASASIGQVHRAILKDGEQVAVKVQRPGIRKTVEVDLEIMLHLATLMERHIEEISFHRPVKIVEEFAKSIEREMDYTIEAGSMERVSAQVFDNPHVVIPKVYRDVSTSRVLTCEFINGIKISKLDQLETAGMDRKIITIRGADVVLSQIFDFGFFHADPHPGNIFVLPGNVICLLDFGMVGTVDRRTREKFVELISGAVQRDEATVSKLLLDLTKWESQPDIREMDRDIADFMGRHLYKPLKDIEIGKLIQQLLELASRHRLRIPPELFLMLKALSTVEGVARMLDPDFDMITRAEPFIKRIKMERLSPGRLTNDVIRLFSQSFDFINNFPKDLLEISRSLKEKKLTFLLELKDLDIMLHTHDQISNRISFSIIIAALIIGSALIVISDIPPLFYGISLIGIIGFLAAAFMGLWLLVAIIRKGKL